ncbi:hypothetical protein JQ633_32930 [Bradyrhizobium tropiciagri]|uniref:hypothetical protein n=1 Tax=Bradyrhizobium tropiciagri TaxID=312253 RepID=UPI001BA986B0|nr:hypothetical protein [Bradyrhizobium tropiciagri]MBR0875204.1 hypothetical protein [Bradyrhizobium tropiciagri]
MTRYFRPGLILGVALLASSVARAQSQNRPPIGGFGSANGAMIFYVAHGAPGACGPGCSDWIAAEGAVQWDSYKRLLAILDRQAGRKLPVVINIKGQSNLNVATSMGRILRDRGIDAAIGATEVDACGDKSEADCFALKRPGGPLDAKEKATDLICDFACVLMLSGGVHRSLPPGSRVVLSGMTIQNRLAPNVSTEQRESLTSIFTEQFRRYLGEMGIDHEMLDVAVRNAGGGRYVEVPASEWERLKLTTQAQP